ncbi:MAG: DNA polymerase I, partial [Firmicutes bacterium]|nr:DNA polymerase I [Bacillota bacterium]
FAEGRRIREAFIPSEPGLVFLAADYSQIELRVLAHLSKDPTLLEAFIKGEDIHQRTAAEIFATPPEEVTPLMRNRAKAINFGIIYGMSDYGLAQDIDVSREEARKYIESYFERYQGVKAYMEEIISQARQTGYVTTILNRRRYLPEINAVNFSRRSFAERTARNTPIQGSAADIIKLAMLKISELLQQNRDQLKARLLLQIHDELIFEVPVDELSKAAELVLECMENAYLLAVPLKVDLKTGKNLYHMHPYKIKE